MPSSGELPAPRLAPGELVVGGLALLTVAVTTWGFAGRAAWAPPVFTALSALAALAAVLLARRERRPVRWQPFLPLLVFAGFIAISLLNPSHTPVPGQVDHWTGRPEWIRWLPATVDRATTLQEMRPWLSALLLAGAIAQTAFSARATRLLWAGLLVHGVIVALVGIYFHVTHPDEILGLVRDRHGYHFASFVYRNHWAAAVILLVPLALGFSFSALRRWTLGRRHFDAVLGGFGLALLLGITLPMPGSRSGLVIFGGLMLFALAKLAATVGRGRRARGAGGRALPLAVIAGFALVVAAGSLFLTRQPVERHWQRTRQQLHGFASGQQELRLRFTLDTLRMAADRPWWGWGIGSFGLVFPRYQGNYLRDAQGRINAQLLHAHNDWAELGAETGLVGFGLFLWLVAARVRRGWASASVLERWAAGGVTLLLAYALADFPLHNPAVLLMAAVVLAGLGRGGPDEAGA